MRLVQKEARKVFEKEHEEALLIKKQTEMQLAEVEIKKGKCVDLLLDGTLDKTTYDKKVSELALQEVELKEALKSRSLVDGEINEMVDSVLEFAGNLAFYFKNSIEQEKQGLLRILVSNSKIEGKKLDFVLCSPFNLMLNDSTCVKWWVLGDLNSRPLPCEGSALAS